MLVNGVPLPEGSPDQSLDDMFSVGDVITIEGRYALNPITMQPTAHLLQFVITATTTSTATLQPIGRIDQRNRRKVKPLGTR